MLLLAVHWQNTITTGSILSVIGWQNIAAFVLIATAVTGVFTVGAARGWKGERDATRDKVDRLERQAKEDREETEKFREAQRVLRHELKAELEALRKLRDPTEVLQHVLAKLDTTVGTVAELLQRAEERAAQRDQIIIETQRELVDAQREIADRLERLVDRITGQVTQAVAEVVQDKLEKE